SLIVDRRLSFVPAVEFFIKQFDKLLFNREKLGSTRLADHIGKFPSVFFLDVHFFGVISDSVIAWTKRVLICRRAADTLGFFLLYASDFISILIIQREKPLCFFRR